MEELFLAAVIGGVVVCLVGKSKKITEASGSVMKNRQAGAGRMKSALDEITKYFKDIAEESRAEIEACKVAVAEVKLHSGKE